MYSKIVLLLSSVMVFGCQSLTNPDTVEYLDTVKLEWKIAQDILAPVVGNKVYDVSWNKFMWKAHQGPFPCGKWPDVNGCVDAGVIHWNINTPDVVRHEAAHAILRKLGHTCAHWVSLDGKRVTIHCCYEKDVKYGPCKKWIEEKF